MCCSDVVLFSIVAVRHWHFKR